MRSIVDRVVPWVALAVGLVLSVSAAWWVHLNAIEEEKMRFQVQAGEQIQRLKRELDVALESVRPLALLFASSDMVERNEFRRFASEIVQRQQALEALAWLPHIAHERREQFERARRADGVTNYSITEADSNNNYSHASDRAEYYPIDYIEPWEVNQGVVGADLGINLAPATALARALASSDVTVTRPIELPWVAGKPRGVLVFVNVGEHSPAFENAEIPSHETSGIIMGVFNLNRLVKQSFPQGAETNLRLTINDAAIQGHADPFYTSSPTDSHPAALGPLSRVETLNVGGRDWIITATQANPGPQAQFGRAAWSVLVGGMAASTLLVGFLSSRIGRKQAHRELGERTGDLREANATLLESRHRVQSIFDAAIDPLWDWDVLTNESVTSPSWKRMLGYASTDDQQEFSWSSRVHPDDYPGTLALLNGCVEGTTDLYEAEYRLRTKTGDWIRVLSRGRAMKRDADGRALRMIGNMTDISSIMAAKEALAASQERFKQIADNIDQVFWMMSTEPRRILYISPAFERIWGQNREELYNDRGAWLQSIHPDDRAMANQACNQWLAAGAKGSYEDVYRIVRPDGGVRWIHDRGSSVRDENGKVYRVVGVAGDVTARIRTEAALAESEELRRAMIEQAAMGIVQVELNGRFALANQRVCDILGYTESELRTRSIWDITHPDDVPRNQQLMDELVNGVVPSFTIEKRYVRGIDRQATWANVAVSLVRDESGKPKYFIVVVEDISQRKLAELALRESEATNRALVAAVPDHLFRMSREGRYLAYHTTDESRLAVPPAEFLGRLVSDVLPLPRAQECMSALQALFETGQPQTYEYEYPATNGHDRYYEVRVVSCGPDEALLLVRDISARKQAEIALQESISDRLRSERLLQQAQSRLSAVLERMPDVVLYDSHPDGKFISENVMNLLGYEASRFVEDRSLFGKLVHPEDADGVETKMRELLDADQTRSLTLQFRVRRADGRQIWLEDRMVSHGTAKSTRRVTGVLIDITERKGAEQRERLMVAELDHRVKNNLAAVLSLAEQSMRTTASSQEFYNVFVNRVRALARLHSALAVSHWEHIHLRPIVEQTLSAFHASDGSEVIIEGKDVVLPGRIGSPLALTLHELATNAVKHGSLSTLHGCLAVSWNIVEEHGQRRLHIMWKESRGPTVVPPIRRGLGRDLIEGGLAHELGGEVKLSFPPEGLMCEIVFPIPSDPR